MSDVAVTRVGATHTHTAHTLSQSAAHTTDAHSYLHNSRWPTRSAGSRSVAPYLCMVVGPLGRLAHRFHRRPLACRSCGPRPLSAPCALPSLNSRPSRWQPVHTHIVTHTRTHARTHTHTHTRTLAARRSPNRSIRIGRASLIHTVVSGHRWRPRHLAGFARKSRRRRGASSWPPAACGRGRRRWGQPGASAQAAWECSRRSTHSASSANLASLARPRCSCLR